MHQLRIENWSNEIASQGLEQFIQTRCTRIRKSCAQFQFYADMLFVTYQELKDEESEYLHHLPTLFSTEHEDFYNPELVEKLQTRYSQSQLDLIALSWTKRFDVSRSFLYLTRSARAYEVSVRLFDQSWNGFLDVIGNKLTNRGEYMRHKWKTRRGWIKVS
ncbi:MAG: hypothetical protein ACMXYF_05965, partial [Candidatus Woesearchaeota archaeon]